MPSMHLHAQPLNETPDFSKSEISLEGEDSCGICLESLAPSGDEGEEKGTALHGCGHLFCNACWVHHVTSRVLMGETNIYCPVSSLFVHVFGYWRGITTFTESFLEYAWRNHQKRSFNNLRNVVKVMWWKCAFGKEGKCITFLRSEQVMKLPCEAGLQFLIESLHKQSSFACLWLLIRVLQPLQ